MRRPPPRSRPRRVSRAGRIVNVTIKLDTMNRPHTSPYGASRAALEMATEVWAKEVEGDLTISTPARAPTRLAWRTRCAL
jgi:NAD(P)-dependent dehydrogenase (short-subunit alcohol dehydrogenase family)